MKAIYYTLVCLSCLLFVAGVAMALGGIVVGCLNFKDWGGFLFAGPALGFLMALAGACFAAGASDFEPR